MTLLYIQSILNVNLLSEVATAQLCEAATKSDSRLSTTLVLVLFLLSACGT